MYDIKPSTKSKTSENKLTFFFILVSVGNLVRNMFHVEKYCDAE
jgi:hypothetical protein